MNDHDEIIRFPFGVPPKNPIPVGTSEEQIDVMLKTPEFVAMDDAYMDYVSQFRKNFVFHPQNGQQILNGCKMVGYDSQKDGWLEYWIVDRAARLINP